MYLLLNDSVFDLCLVALQLFYGHAVLLLGKVFSQDGLIMTSTSDQITSVKKSASSAGILEVQ